MSMRFLSLPLSAIALSAMALATAGTARAQGAAGNNAALPPLPGQEQIARQADQSDINDIHGFLTSARAALARRQFGQANEFIERAESRILTRSLSVTAPSASAANAEVLARAARPYEGPVVRALSQARAALAQRDIRGTQAALDEADAALARPAPPPRDGRPMPPPPPGVMPPPPMR
ncbi:hypothetical protein MVG78_00350 [Roseomonas gilardii subsp. gilardii]|uniref:hypothetical protein n=1 Tax=Roseomonas gilardii TaxID=257708 RepID=UPI001FF700D6|nr:hypothetical protein [Roseomonas gilardii]UPG72688.1 hypothetical protein MVG78_00350 [Roseomonas gilardii subsp. gilardii]